MAEEEYYANEEEYYANEEGTDALGLPGTEEAMDEGEAGTEAQPSSAGDTAAEVAELKRKLEEMQQEAAMLREMQQGGKPGGPASATTADTAGPNGAAVTDDAKAETDARSIFVGQVDYGTTPEELQQHFSSCGTVNRVTILTDRSGSPKGYAYIEFLEVDAVANALMLDASELRGRPIKVSAKRTNVPGLKRGRGGARGRGYSPYYGGRGGGRYGGYYGGRGGGYGGYAPRGRGRGRFAPY